MMQLHTAASAAPHFPHAGLPVIGGMDDVVLRHLRTDDEIKAVVPMREDNIGLSVHAANADFKRLEKKETSWAWSSALSLTKSS